MINPVVEKNIEILKKIRLLNIEKDNLFYSDYSAWRNYHKYSIGELSAKKDKLNEEILEIKKGIKDDEKAIEDAWLDINPQLEEEQREELHDLRVENANIKLNEKKLNLELKNKEIEDIDKELANYEDMFTQYAKALSIDEGEKNDKIIEICRSINYMKDLLNKEISVQYDLIEKNFREKNFRYVVANIVDGFCENCNINVPIYQKDLILGKSEFVMCDNCGCFLVDFNK